MIRIAAIYPNAADSRFDGTYYRDRHTAFARGLLEPHGLIAISTTLGLAALDGAPPPFWAIAEMTFPSREAFDAAIAACGEALFADIPNYTDVTPVLQVCGTEP
ncbi:MAG: hypothetical protein RIS94_2285 [Pseudomonadota bacterium]|jgi:uncharacterized protein (TIGR02118 family)